MRKGLQLTAAAVAGLGLAFWFFGGPNLGKTKTQVPVREVSRMTGLEETRWERRFVPGVDFLAGSFAVAGVILGGSFLVRRE